MEVKNVKVTPANDITAGEKMEFDLCNVDNSFANGLRRVMLAEIPILAVDTVTVRTNTSVFFDEMVVHRLAMVPWDSITANDWADEDEIVFDLKVRCPSDLHSRRVTTADLPAVYWRGQTHVKPIAVGDGIWLLTLGRGQEFDCKCTIKRGIAKLHSKWMAVSTVAMRYAADIRLNPKGFAALPEEHRRLWVNRCPVNVFAHNDNTGQVEVVNKAACIFCKECLTIDPPFNELPAPLVSMRQKKDEWGQFDFHFTVESTGQLPVVELVRRAVLVLRKKLEDIREGLKESQKGGTGHLPTRPIGIAPTTVRVVNEDVVHRGRDDDLSHLQH